MTPAITIATIEFELQILSFTDGCVVKYHSTQYAATSPLSPEEAELMGIDLFQIVDTGVSMSITLGEELRDWRFFSQTSPDDIELMGEKLFLRNIGMAVWANPRIVKTIDTWKQQGIRLRSPDSVPKQQASAEVLATAEIARMPDFCFQPQLPVVPSNLQTSPVFAVWDCRKLMVSGKKEAESLCNFIPIPLRREYRFDAAGQRVVCYLIRVHFYEYERDIGVSEMELKCIYDTIVKSVDGAVIYKSTKVANHYLSIFIRENLNRMPYPDITKLIQGGWQRIENQMVYGMDGREIRPGVVFDTGKHLVVDASLTSRDLWGYFREMIYISQEAGPISLMVVYSFLGLMYHIFLDAGFPIQFLMNVVGTTGSLKTSLCKVLYGIFNTDMPDTSRVHSFTDTKTSVEQYIASLKDEVGLVDDLELGDSDTEARRQRDIYNDLVRMVGDGKGKNRSNAALADVKAKVAKGLVVVTAEQSLGKQSTRLRTVEACISKSSIQGDALSNFQNNLNRWPTLCASFIDFLEKNYEVSVNYVRTNHLVLREEYKYKFKQLRSVDQLITFRIAADILYQFFNLRVGGLAEIEQVFTQIYDGIEAALLQSVDGDEVENPGIRVLLDLDALISAGEVKIATSRQEYIEVGHGFLGFAESGFLFLLRDVMFENVQAYEARMRRRFAFDITKCCRSMDELGVLCRFPNGKTQTFNLRIDTGAGKQSFIKLDAHKMQKLVDTYA